MNSDFKVMPWLRAVRDKQAKELAGLPVSEMLRISKERSGPLMKDFLKAHPQARCCSNLPVSKVAETYAQYGKTRTGPR